MLGKLSLVVKASKCRARKSITGDIKRSLEKTVAFKKEMVEMGMDRNVRLIYWDALFWSGVQIVARSTVLDTGTVLL